MRFLSLLILLSCAFTVHAQWPPAKSDRLVNDYSGILDAIQVQKLEQRLVAFNDSTSNQVVVVITPTIGGDDENAAAQQIGESWGVGQEEFDNGVVILIKSKTNDEDWGAVAIATGYGVEGALPDLFCKSIIDDHMLGQLGYGEYYNAICEALDIMLPVLAGEYSYAQYKRDEDREARIALIGFGIFMALIVFLCIRIAEKHPELWRGGHGGGIWGGPSGGSWGFGGGHGGSFGGFGGGSFGGGGASGRF